jgi:hypothetical protein
MFIQVTTEHNEAHLTYDTRSRKTMNKKLREISKQNFLILPVANLGKVSEALSQN